MGIRFCSYSVYGLGYCPTMSWSAIVNSMCDTYTLFATRLRFDLYTFWDIFGRVWFLEFCVQQFWACKFTVSLCLLLLVRRIEAKRVEAKWDEESWRELKRREEFESVWLDDIFFGHLVAEFVTTSSFTIWRWSRCSFVLSSEAIGLADDQTAVCRVCRRIYDRFSLPYQGTVSYWLITAFSDGHVVVCGIIVSYCVN